MFHNYYGRVPELSGCPPPPASCRLLNILQTVIATLGELHAALDRLRGEFVHGIKTPADYERATDLLDELTDGRELSKVEEKILVELEDEILAYQRDSDQFRESNAAFEATCTPVQLIKDLMETLGLTIV